ncbi:MAG: hypothetical protein HRT46_12435 [Deltaproteobacteria bacterium]|nr:hypothetical protein [Deltaproteobacteria bacterium]
MGDVTTPPQDATADATNATDATDATGVPDAPDPFCGDGVIDEDDESCDLFNIGPRTCLDYGFSGGGQLTCTAQCTVDTASCIPETENCFDGIDNDGDSAIDCTDTDDCSAACVDSCSNFPILSPNGEVEITSDTTGRPALTDSTCSSAASGPELIFQYTADKDGILELRLDDEALLNVSIRTTCNDPGTEIVCHGDLVNQAVTNGEVLYVVIDGYNAGSFGAFTLTAETRVPTCGDDDHDPGEECDDGNVETGDGCDGICEVESSETADNNTTATATPYAGGFFVGQISPIGDVDVISVVLTETISSIVANVYDLNDGWCATRRLDSVLDVYDTDGVTILLTDDDGGDNLCSRAIVPELPPGTYYVAVRSLPGADNETFPYRVRINIDVCGDNIEGVGEECDDNNLIPDDGCSATCTDE